MDALQAKMMVLRLDMLLLESSAFQTVIEQRGLHVSDDALPTCQLSLFMQESAQLPSHCGRGTFPNSQNRSSFLSCRFINSAKSNNFGGRRPGNRCLKSHRQT
jgi:hypothetical protein